MNDDKLLISAAETACLLGVSKPIVYQLCRRDDFPSVTIGTRVLIHRAGLENWVNEQVSNKLEVAV